MEIFLFVVGLVFLACVLVVPAAVIWLVIRVRDLSRDMDLIKAGGVAAPQRGVASQPSQQPAPQTRVAPKPSRQPAPQATGAEEQAVAQPSSGSKAPVSGKEKGKDASARILAFGGGFFVLMAALFFLAMAINNGWLTRELQVALAYIGGALVSFIGFRIYETAGAAPSERHNVGAIVLGAGVGIFQLAAVVGTQGYEIVDPWIGLIVAMVVSVATVAIADRWNQIYLAGIGIAVGLGAPILVDAPAELLTLAFVGAALVAAVGICVVRGWSWLMTVALVVTAPQLVSWLDDVVQKVSEFHLPHLPILAGKDAITTHETVVIHTPTVGLSTALVVVGVWWILMTLGASMWQVRNADVPLPRQMVTQLFGASAVALTGLLMIVDGFQISSIRPLVLVGFAIAHVVVGSIVAVRWPAGRAFAILMSVVGFALAGGAAADKFDGVANVLVWCVEALILLWVWLRFDDARAGMGSVALSALSIGHVLQQDAVPESLLFRSSEPVNAALGLLIIVASSIAAYGVSQYVVSSEEMDDKTRSLALKVGKIGVGICATSIWYLASITLVTIVGAGGPDVSEFQRGSDIGIVEPDQVAQVVLSTFWGIIGLVALVVGVNGKKRTLLRIGTVMFAVVAAKVLVIDTENLESGFRVLSFMAVGVLLIAGAKIYSRLSDEVGRDEEDQ